MRNNGCFNRQRSREIQLEHELHLTRLRKIRSTTAGHRTRVQPPRYAVTNRKRFLTLEEEYQRIMKDNRTLLEKMIQIDNRKNSSTTRNSLQIPLFLTPSLNIAIKKRRYDEINSSNFKFHRRLIEVKPHIDHSRLERSFRKASYIKSLIMQNSTKKEKNRYFISKDYGELSINELRSSAPFPFSKRPFSAAPKVVSYL